MLAMLPRSSLSSRMITRISLRRIWTVLSPGSRIGIKIIIISNCSFLVVGLFCIGGEGWRLVKDTTFVAWVLLFVLQIKIG